MVIVIEKSRRAQAALAVLLFLVTWVIPALAQQKEPEQSSQDTSTATQTQPPASYTKGTEASAQKPMTPAEARQAQLMADTQRLYQLTQELKEEVAKSNKDTLSVSVIKKADEVEKLAKSLKDRMRAPQ